MAATIASFTVNIDGVLYEFRGLTDNDVATLNAMLLKVKSNSEELTSLKSYLDSFAQGAARITNIDPSDPDNVEQFEDGIFYEAPMNAAGQFIKLDLETMQPAAEQADGVTDTTVDHIDVYYKSSGSMGLIYSFQIGENLENFAKLTAANAFTAMNTFSAGITLGDEQDKDTLDDSRVPQYGTVKAYADAAATSKAEAAEAAAVTEAMQQVEAKGYAVAETVTSDIAAAKSEAISEAVSEVEEKGYITADALTDYAKTEDVTSQIAAAQAQATSDAVSQVEEKGYITADALAEYATSASVTEQIEAAKTEINSAIESADYATKTEAQEMADTAKTEAISEVEAKGYVTMSVSASEPDQESMTTGTLYVFPASDLISGSVD